MHIVPRIVNSPSLNTKDDKYSSSVGLEMLSEYKSLPSILSRDNRINSNPNATGSLEIIATSCLKLVTNF